MLFTILADAAYPPSIDPGPAPSPMPPTAFTGADVEWGLILVVVLFTLAVVLTAATSPSRRRR